MSEQCTYVLTQENISVGPLIRFIHIDNEILKSPQHKCVQVVIIALLMGKYSSCCSMY